MRQVFLDTETTGLSPDHGDRVVEIGCVEFVNRRLTGRTLHHYLNPERANSADALKVHGISDEFLADKPLFASVADELLAFIGGAEVVAHNAAFDVAFIDAELARAGRERLSSVVAKVTDTLALAREMYPGKSNSLDALCRRLEVDNTNRTLHGALLDANLLAEVYIRMTRGQDSLMMESVAAHAGTHEAGPAVDLSAFDLVVIEPSDEERAAHEAWLADLDKSSGGRTVWQGRVA